MKPGKVLDLGLIHYKEAWEIQKDYHRHRVNGEIPDTLIFLEHYPVITLGKSANGKHLLASRERLEKQGVEIFSVERGGDVTFHGPGQLVGYPILEIKNGLGGVKPFVRKLEEAIINGLKPFGIEAKTNPPYTGVWVDNEKIASIGIAVKQWVSFHGFALNVTTDLSFFDLIVPCGIAGVRMTSVKKLSGRAVEMAEVKKTMRQSFAEVMGMEIIKSEQNV
jgi:lipoyl(octanoyl) transferase